MLNLEDFKTREALHTAFQQFSQRISLFVEMGFSTPPCLPHMLKKSLYRNTRPAAASQTEVQWPPVVGSEDR